MSTEIRWRRGTTVQNDAFTGAQGEITVDTTNNSLRIHDGVTVGGHRTDDAVNIGYLPAGTGAVATDVQSKLRESVSVLDFANLAVVTSARDPNDPASHLLTSFLNWTPAINAALDAAYQQGGGVVVLPKNTVPYYVQDPIIVKSNTTFIFEDWLVLADYNLIGGTLMAVGDNISVLNVQIDNSGIYAGGSGYNGIGAQGKNIKFYGGHIKNCARGSDPSPMSPNDGGKGCQLESSNIESVVIDGITFSNCFMAMSTIRGFENPENIYGIVYNNITADNCEILFFVRQTNGYDQTGLEHSVQLNNFYAVNCGAFEGVFQFSRASNVRVSNGTVVNDPGVVATSLIRGNHANCQFVDIGFYGDAPAVVQLDPSTYAPDDSYANQNNRYEIQVWGQVDTLLNANIATAFRTLNNCFGSLQCRLDPTTGWFGGELRNGTSAFTLTQNNKVFHGATNLNFVGNPTSQPVKFSDLEANKSVAQYHGVRLQNANSTNLRLLDWYEEGTWTPTFEADSGSGAAFTSSGTFTRIGNVVTIRGVVSPTNFGTLSARVRIGGVPFNAVSSSFGSCSVSFATLTAINVAASIGTISNSHVAFPWMGSGGGGDSIRIANVVAGSSVFQFAVTYFAA
jgi:hypothetical protein